MHASRITIVMVAAVGVLIEAISKPLLVFYDRLEYGYCAFAILLFRHFCPRWKRIYIAAVVSLSGLPGGNIRLPIVPHRRGFLILGSHVGRPAIDALREGKRQLHQRCGMTQPDDSCIIYSSLISRRIRERKKAQEKEREGAWKNAFREYASPLLSGSRINL